MRCRLLVSLLLSLLICAPLYAQVPDPNAGMTAWVLLGTNPEFSKSQELRIGYEGLLPGIEVAVGGLHLDGPDPGVEEWSMRGYLIAHALDAKMIAQFLGTNVTLPEGNLYGGLFGQYSFDRSDEWSGGYLFGGLIAWPKRWETVGEYSANLWNNDHDSYTFVVGLRKRF